MVDSKSGGDHAEYLGMLRRMLKAGARRLASADPEDLVAMVALRGSLDEAIATSVQGMRDNGFSWAEIAEPLGITRQAAYQKWGKTK